MNQMANEETNQYNNWLIIKTQKRIGELLN